MWTLSISLAGELPVAPAWGNVGLSVLPGALAGWGQPHLHFHPCPQQLWASLMLAYVSGFCLLVPTGSPGGLFLHLQWIESWSALPSLFSFAHTNFGESVEGDLHSLSLVLIKFTHFLFVGQFSADLKLIWREWVVKNMSSDCHLILEVSMLIFHWLYFLLFLIEKNLKR